MRRIIGTIAATTIICGAALATPAQAHTRHVHNSSRDAAYLAVSPDAGAPASSLHRTTPVPYEEPHGSATGGPSGGLPGGS